MATGIRHWLAASLAVLAVCAARPALAGETSPVVFESHVGQRPPAADASVGVVVAALAREGYRVGPGGAGEAYEATVSRPGSTVEPAWAAGFAAEVEKGYGSWLRGSFDEAIALLAPLLDQALMTPATFVTDEALRAARLKAMITLAMSRQRVGETEPATETWSELVRSYPLEAPNRSAFGPEIARNHELALRRMSKLGTGTVSIEVSEAEAAVYVNERKLGNGSQTGVALSPGEYRVYVAAPDRRGRLYALTVVRGQQTTLAIDSRTDAVLVTGPGWFGGEFVDAAARQQEELPRAVAVGRALGAKTVVIVGELTGERAVYGLTVEVERGKVLRRGKVPLDGTEATEGLAELGAYLAGKAAQPVITVLDPVDRSHDHAAASLAVHGAVRGPSRLPAWLSVGAAVASFAAGGVLLSIDGACTADPIAPAIECARLYDTAISAYAAIGAGAAFTGAAIYFFVRGGDEPSRESRRIAAFPLPGGGLGVVASWRR